MFLSMPFGAFCGESRVRAMARASKRWLQKSTGKNTLVSKYRAIGDDGEYTKSFHFGYDVF